MKFNFNWLKEYVDIKITPEKLAEILSERSFDTTLAYADSTRTNADKFLRRSTFSQRQSAILDVDIPPNRISDAANYIGMAQELVAATNSKSKIQNPKSKILNSKIKTKDFLTIRVQEPKLCRRYVGKIILNIKVGQSPKWLKERLEFHGMKSINNAVDAANYVMLETGQPLHIFDFDKVENMEIRNPKSEIRNKFKFPNSKFKTIFIRRAKKGEKITTLDGEEKILDESILVIADSNNPCKSVSNPCESATLAIAGIKGGRKAEITNETKNLILESANFDAENIYLASRRLNLKTDASLRFEHNLDPNTAGFAIKRLANLICQLAGGQAAIDAVDIFPKKPDTVILDFDFGRFHKFSGFEIKKEEIFDVFKRLNFNLVAETRGTKRGTTQKILRQSLFSQREPALISYRVSIPVYRRDISIVEDLYEEILRIYGYNKMPSNNPKGLVGGVFSNENILFENKAKNILASMSFDEVYNYSFTGMTRIDADQNADKRGQYLRINADIYTDKRGFNIRENPRVYPRESALVELENPLTEDKKYLRTTLLCGLLQNAKDNFRFLRLRSGQDFENLRIFEIGKVFLQTTDYRLQTTVKNKKVVVRSPSTVDWCIEAKKIAGIIAAKKIPEKDALFFEAKGVVETLFEQNGLDKDDYQIKDGGSTSSPLEVALSDFQRRLLDSGKSAAIISDNGDFLGCFGEIKKEILDHCDIKGNAAGFELDFDNLLKEIKEEKEYEPLSLYPSIIRDISIMVGYSCRVDDVLKVIYEAGAKFIDDVDLFDIYEDANLVGAKKSMAFHIIFQAEDRTLTDKEADLEMEKIINTLKEKLGAEIR